MPVSKSWRRIAEIYRRFAGDLPELDFSESAAEEMFLFESRGIGNLKHGLFPRDGRWNGYAVGKRWMDVTAKMWREDLAAGLLFSWELEEEYPAWFLKRILPGTFS